LQENTSMEGSHVGNTNALQNLPEGTRGAATPGGQAESPPSTPLRKSRRSLLKLTPERPKAPVCADGRKRRTKRRQLRRRTPKKTKNESQLQMY
jgi:hypothetical protein